MEYDEIRVDIVDDRPKSGVWHCGPNACWITATHEPTGTSVRIFSGGYSQHKARHNALMLLEMALEVARDELPQFLENLQ